MFSIGLCFVHPDVGETSPTPIFRYSVDFSQLTRYVAFDRVYGLVVVGHGSILALNRYF